MIGFIDDHREVYGVEPICKVLPIAPSTYRVQAARRCDLAKLPARAQRDAALEAVVLDHHHRHWRKLRSQAGLPMSWRPRARV